ncbi:calcium-binding protein [Acinetobacter sp. 161(2023)]|uniref:calcium-binding protein n=1 Tax=Acinetobacter sp. 161(2023) TaxID=3098768 RepID=UPI00300B073E
MKTYNEIITELSNANASGYIYSLNELHDLVRQASGSLSENTTLTSYYSGSAFLDQDVSTGLYQEPISTNSYGDIGRIGQTEVSYLSREQSFRDALENTLDSMGVIDSYQFNKEGTAAYEFWNGSGGIDPSTGEHVPSIWNTISEVYARDTKGDVLALVPFADDNRIWAQTELPTLLDNPNVTSINGIPIDELRTNLQSNGYNQVFEDIKTQSVLIMSEFQYVRDTSTGRIAAVDTGQVLSKYFGVEDVTIDPFITIQNPTYEIRPQYEAYGYSEIYNSQLGLIRETHIQNSPYLTDIQKSHFLEVAGKTGGVLGSALTVLGLIALSSQVQAAETSEQKQQIIDDWVAHTTAEWIAGSIGSALVVGGVAAFTAVSAPVTLALAIVGGIVGSIVGGDTVYDYIKNGVNALLDDIKTWWLLWEKLLSDTGMGNFEESADLDLVQEIDRGDSLSLYLNHGGLGTRVPFKSSSIMLDHIETNTHASTDTGLSEGDLAKNNFGAETVPIVEENRNNIISTDIGDKLIHGDTGNDYLVGGSGNDYLKGDYGNDLLEGGDGEDYLFGEDGDDTLIGGRGSDELEGGSGINTYIFNKGDGVDEIRSYDFYEGKSQYIAETHIILDVLPDDIWVNASADYVFLRIKDTTDQLYIKDPWNANIGLKTITFADQTVWTITDILAHPLLGTEDDDYLVNMNAYDATIYGLAGNDHLYGSIGNDYLDGGTGNDYLDGGIGDDYLDGGDGVNTYVFNRGYGDDIVSSAVGANSLPTETYILMDVLPSDISVEISYTNVFVSIDDTGDFLEILGVFQESSAFKTITFADQTVWTIQDLQNSASIDSNQDESLTDLLNGLADNSNYEEYGYLFDELSDNQSLVGQLEGNNTQVLTDSLILEESSDVDYPFNLLTIEDMQKFNIDVDKLLRSANANSESEDTQNVKNSLTQKYQLDEVDDQIVFDNTSFSMPNNIGLWNTSFNQQFIA